MPLVTSIAFDQVKFSGKWSIQFGTAVIAWLPRRDSIDMFGSVGIPARSLGFDAALTEHPRPRGDLGLNLALELRGRIRHQHIAVVEDALFHLRRAHDTDHFRTELVDDGRRQVRRPQ